MPTEELTKEQQTNKAGLEIIAEIAYCTRVPVEALRLPLKYIPAGHLKDFCILFMENQRNWNGKIMRAAKEYGRTIGVDVAGVLEKDMNNDELVAYYAIISDLKQCRHMEDVSSIVRKINTIEREEDVAPELIKWLTQIELNK